MNHQSYIVERENNGHSAKYHCTIITRKYINETCEKHMHEACNMYVSIKKNVDIHAKMNPIQLLCAYAIDMSAHIFMHYDIPGTYNKQQHQGSFE